MKILGIIGSPRKGGNTDILVSEVLKGAEVGASQRLIPTIEKIYLDDFKLLPCKVCGKCKDTGKCVQPDDFNLILQKIKNSDAIVLGSPVYCKTVTAQTKILIDKVDSSQIIISSNPDGTTKFSRRQKLEQRSPPMWRQELPSDTTTPRKAVIICIGDLSGLNILKQSAEVIRCLFHDLNIKVIDEILANKLSSPEDALKNKPLLERSLTIGASL